jgi:hypothetical protein
MAGAVYLPPKAFWLESVKSRGLGRRPISRLVSIPLAGDLSADVVCTENKALRHLHSPLLDSTSQGPDLTIRKVAGMFLSKLPKEFFRSDVGAEFKLFLDSGPHALKWIRPSSPVVFGLLSMRGPHLTQLPERS